MFAGNGGLSFWLAMSRFRSAYRAAYSPDASPFEVLVKLRPYKPSQRLFSVENAVPTGWIYEAGFGTIDILHGQGIFNRLFTVRDQICCVSTVF